MLGLWGTHANRSADLEGAGNASIVSQRGVPLDLGKPPYSKKDFSTVSVGARQVDTMQEL